MNSSAFELYSKMYRCELCSHFSDPDGVRPFCRPGPEQTIPVSHFGNIDRAKIWLIATNPAGDRNDPNVSLLSSNVDPEASSRSGLSDEAVQAAFRKFSSYFSNQPIHSFFNPYIKVIDGLSLRGEPLTLSNGDVCVVDAIKCPTESSWAGYVRKKEGKDVWHNCLGNVGNPGPNRFLVRQLELHKPIIRFFSAGTDQLVPASHKGKREKGLEKLANEIGSNLLREVRRHPSGQSLSIALGPAREIRNSQDEVLMDLHRVIQLILDQQFSG